MSTLLANYQPERQAIEALFRPDCPRRILLLRGKSGSGKTTLLSYCQRHTPIPHLPIQFRGSTVNMVEIFYRAGRKFSWTHLRAFTLQVADLQRAPTVTIDRNWLVGINNHIDVALHAENPLDREHRRVLLTDAWFDDLQAFDQPVLLLFDTYEQATTEVQEWISGPFLARAAQVEQVRIVIAGQTAPEAHNIEWGDCCTVRDLYGVKEAQHWLPVVEQMNRLIPFGEPLTWLAGVCHALDGNPQSIMKIIEGLPLKEGVV